MALGCAFRMAKKAARCGHPGHRVGLRTGRPRSRISVCASASSAERRGGRGRALPGPGRITPAMTWGTSSPSVGTCPESRPRTFFRSLKKYSMKTSVSSRTRTFSQAAMNCAGEFFRKRVGGAQLQDRDVLAALFGQQVRRPRRTARRRRRFLRGISSPFSGCAR